MRCHQVLTGACNTGDGTFAVGRVEGIPFTAYAAGCNVVILAQNFERVQVIPGVCHDNVQISCIDCSTDTGKIAAAYGKLACIFEPSPIASNHTNHRLDYAWVQTGVVEASCCINNIAWNLEGSRLITAGDVLQMWSPKSGHPHEDELPVVFDLGGLSTEDSAGGDGDLGVWECVWEMTTAQPTQLLSFSPDGCLFATCSANDRLIKLWYDNTHVVSGPSVTATINNTEGSNTSNSPAVTSGAVSYSFVYLPHPAAVTGFTWRSTSKYMPRSSVSNMLVSSCRDNICRVWVETVLPDDGMLAMQQLDPIAAQNPRFRTHRHKHRFISRLKHIKACFGARRPNKYFDHSSFNVGHIPTPGAQPEPLPTMPSSYSVHDLPSYGFHAMGVTPGFHFHLAASINAATDIPLVPSLAPGGTTGSPDDSDHNFVLHWLNNKEMHFTQEAENILLEVSKKALEKEIPNHIEADRHSEISEVCPTSTQQSGTNKGGSRPTSHMAMKGRSFEEDESPGGGGGAGRAVASHPHLPQSQHNQLSAATSTTSIATDVTTGTATTALGDALDRRIESLLRNWLQSSDMLFSVHPVDGSLLVWILDFLDDYPGSFRQTQVSFCARIPNALPLGDAMTMSPHLALYTAPAVSFVKQLVKIEMAHEEDCRNFKAGLRCSTRPGMTQLSYQSGTEEAEAPNSPVVCMTTKHANGSLNLWHLTVENGSKFTQVLNILHQRRVCGHRFQLNAVKCHPELPLLLTTSHHNRQPETDATAPASAPDHTPLICVQDPGYKDWCSELLVWRVDSVGPLGRSGGVTELARLNSSQPKAFSNAAWIPTLLPSYSLGSLCNSPSACFVASDGERLRVYQAVLDGRALLAEMSMAERRTRRNIDGSTMSLSTDSSLREQAGHPNLAEVFNIVSEQSSARPGCVLELAALDDTPHHSHTTQLLHVYQEGLVLGQDSAGFGSKDAGEQRSGQHQQGMVEEPFYVTRLEETATGSVVHMWRLVMATQQQHHSPDLLASPDDIDEHDDVFSSGPPAATKQEQQQQEQQQHRHLEVSPVLSKTAKVCCQRLPLPPGVGVLHAAPSAGHLSSACIYPACRAPYLMVTACTDNTVRFWRCTVSGSSDENMAVEWTEWNMISKSRQSSITLPGVPMHVSCAYSGRIACAYLPPEQAAVVTPWPDSSASKFSCKVAVYECESTGGSQWVMCEPVTIEDVVSTDSWQLGEQLLDQAYVNKVSQCRTASSNLASALSSENLHNLHHQEPPSSPSLSYTTGGGGLSGGTKGGLTSTASLGHSGGAVNDNTGDNALRSVSSMLFVPSMSTIHSIRSKKYCKRGTRVKQRMSVQLDWVSKEDGSFMLTVAIGSKIVVLSDVSEEVAALAGTESGVGSAGVEGATATATGRAPALKKSLSMHQIALPNIQKYLELSRVQLRTADNLAPLPMSIGWVREGLLIVGMDNEMHCYTQWTECSANSASTHSKLLNLRQLRPSITNSSPAYALLYSANKRVGDLQFISAEPYTVGLMEASQAASPVLPLYHPRQLNELLNSGKIRRVKAILGHLLRYLTQLSQQSGGEGAAGAAVSTMLPCDSKASWSRSRALSVIAQQHCGVPGSREGRGSLSLRPEDLSNLTLLEVKAVPPMPLWMLLQADRETTLPHQQETKDETYAELFGSTVPVGEDEDDFLHLDVDDTDRPARRASLSHEGRGLTYFGPRQTQCLAALLTHTQLPGLSSLDQMHLLALADTVASCNLGFADKFDINKAKEAIAKEAYSRSATDEPSMDALDDCGLRYLLALRHHTYLVRCLPMGQRSSLQMKGIGCHNMAWAFHSESQDELLQFIPSCRQGNPRWGELREMGVGWWVRNNTLLSKLILMVAKSAFHQRKDPLDAAIYYLAMKKKSLVWGLFRSIGDKRMTDFFASDFSQERWRKAALKNAFALMGKQRFEHAGAFFLLAGALKDAVEVVVTQLHDEQLAMVIIRLYEGELEATPPALKRMLYTRVMGRDDSGNNEEVTHLHPDPFLRSMAYWLMRDYSSSLHTLLHTDPTLATLHPAYDESSVSRHRTTVTTADPSVFNFYIYLRTHPLLIRQCIANTARDTGGLMASRLAVGADSLNKKSAYESSMTPLERCLYFTTAYAHLQTGCPMLALEVLSKLPDNVLDAVKMQEDGNSAAGGGDSNSVASPSSRDRPSLSMIHTGTLDGGTIGDDPSQQASAFDWGSSTLDSGGGAGGTGGDELQLDFSIDASDDEDDIDSKKQEQQKPPTVTGAVGYQQHGKTEMGVSSRKLKGSDGGDSNTAGGSSSHRKQLDVMAQQLKFIACLKIMMSELVALGTINNSSTTVAYTTSAGATNTVAGTPSATASGGASGTSAAGSYAVAAGSTVPGAIEECGGQLRHELHFWLERQVHALNEMCGYTPSVRMPDGDDMLSSGVVSGSCAGGLDDLPGALSSSPGGVAAAPDASSLHDMLQREKLQFEEKLERAARRKRWLTGNHKLLHTLLSYCSLHGCSGGGLTLVRLELVLLLQELQQEAAARNMLLSPLPCPTTLPLLSAAVATKTVGADPIKLLQSLGHDLLSTLVEMHNMGSSAGSPVVLGKVCVLRDLAVALSSCVHQALSDSEALLKHRHRAGDGQSRPDGGSEDHLQVTTQPSKWPGVTSLLCLMTREKDEDTPKLSLLLCEALVGVYLCLFVYGLVTCDPAILYRLVSHNFTEKEWALIFGGGVKKMVKVIPSIPQQVMQSQSIDRDMAGSPTANTPSSGGIAGVGATLPGGGEHLLSSTLSSLQKTRFKFNMKLLGQLGFQEARSQAQDGENKPAHREQFLSPTTSIVAFLLSKTRLPCDYDNIDYDSSGSDDEELLDDTYEEEEDIFKEPKILAENKEHSDHTSYSWCLLRLACVRKAQGIVKSFMEVPQIDIQELAVQSPLLHSVLCALESWSNELTQHLEALLGPPPEYIPGCFAQSATPGTAAISKYRALLELHNTPFSRGQKGVACVERLWHYLVRQDHVQELFVRYIFARKRPAPEQHPHPCNISEDALSDSGDGGGGGADDMSEAGARESSSLHGGVTEQHSETGAAGAGGVLPALEPVRIIHKEQDSIVAFCINKVNSGLMSVATVKEVQELDISLLLQHPAWLNNPTELDLLSFSKDMDTISSSSYLVVQCPSDKELLEQNKGFLDGSGGLGSSSSSLNHAQSGRGASVIRSHKTEGARRMTAHPVLPIYLVGCQDGSVTVREWQHTGVVARPRPGGTFAKVTRLRFNQQGNKFGVMDADGNLSLYHLGLGTQVNKPFYSQQCHNKHGSDFAFVGSSSLLASCGQSSDHRNVALWDTLLPPRKANVVSWLCHDSGAAAMLYAPQHQLLMSAGKRGTICIFDVRQRSMRHKFQAHESAIKCMALDQSEEFFVTGAADGDIKVWGLSVHNLIYNLAGEHSRTSLFKNLSQGVTQLHLDTSNRLFSCGADGSIKLRTFPERDLNLNLI